MGKPELKPKSVAACDHRKRFRVRRFLKKFSLTLIYMNSSIGHRST